MKIIKSTFFEDPTFITWYERFKRNEDTSENGESFNAIWNQINKKVQNPITTEKILKSLLYTTLYELTYKNKDIYPAKIREKFKNASISGKEALFETYIAIKDAEGEVVKTNSSNVWNFLDDTTTFNCCLRAGNFTEDIYDFEYIRGKAKIKEVKENFASAQMCITYEKPISIDDETAIKYIESLSLRYVLDDNNLKGINSKKACTFPRYQRPEDKSICKNLNATTVSTTAIGEDELYLIVRDKHLKVLEKYGLTDERLKNTILKNKDVSRWITKITKNELSHIYV